MRIMGHQKAKSHNADWPLAWLRMASLRAALRWATLQPSHGVLPRSVRTSHQQYLSFYARFCRMLISQPAESPRPLWGKRIARLS